MIGLIFKWRCSSDNALYLICSRACNFVVVPVGACRAQEQLRLFMGTIDWSFGRIRIVKKHLILSLALSSTCYFAPFAGAPALKAFAQERVIPAPDPDVGAAPPGPDKAQETHDEVSIQQLTKMVYLSRLIAGGISQMFGSAETQRKLLDEIRGAQTGRKNIPNMNDPDNVEARSGGQGLKEMADSAINGTPEGPTELVKALNQFRTTFDLDKAFKLKDDELLNKRLLAQLAAKGIVASSSAEAAYKRANASNARLGEFITSLEASPDLKTSIDLNTRVMIELTQQSNESLRIQSAITSIVGSYFMVLASEASASSWVENLKDFNR